MTRPLYLVWQDSFLQGVPIIDEQHRGVLATINSLHYFLQQGHGLDVLMPTVKICLSYMNFHASTEESLLRACDYPDIEAYVESNKQIIVDFKRTCREALLNKEPELVLQFLRKWWLDHMALHEQTTPALLAGGDSFCRLS